MKIKLQQRAGGGQGLRKNPCEELRYLGQGHGKIKHTQKKNLLVVATKTPFIFIKKKCFEQGAEMSTFASFYVGA